MADENRTINELSAGAGMLGYNNALPFSPEAEQSVLGAILLDSSCLDRVAEILSLIHIFSCLNYTNFQLEYQLSERIKLFFQ